MNKTAALWVVIAFLLASRSFVRPAYAVALYMFTFLVAPTAWWWGDFLENYRWNFFAGTLLLLTVVATRSDDAMEAERPLATNAIPILVLMAINAAFVHFLLAVNADSSFGWLIIRLKFILLFLMIQYAIRDQKDFRIVAVAIALGIGYIGYEATINERGSFSGGRLEGIGAAGVASSNHLASLLVTAVPLAVTVLFTDVSKWVKGAVLLACGFAFNVVLLCNSRGAFLGLILGGLAFLFMASGPARKQSRRIIGLAAVATFLLLGDPEIIQRFMTTFNSEGQRDTSAESRITFWTAATYMIRDYPLGSGGNSFSEGRGAQYLAGETRTETRAIHNGFLTETTDWGIQGGLLAVAFLSAIWQTLLRGRRLARLAGDTNAMMVFACIATALTAWIVSSIFGDYLNDEWGFWTAAFAYSYLRVRLLAPAAQQPRPVDSVRAPSRTWSPVIRPGAAR
jgi:putative inorganic carbon (hco3(-)) transporter